MPIVNVKAIEGVFDQQQKQQMIEKMTDAVVSVEGEYLRPVTVVVIDEVKSNDWGIAGQPISTEAVAEMAASDGSGNP